MGAIIQDMLYALQPLVGPLKWFCSRSAFEDACTANHPVSLDPSISHRLQDPGSLVFFLQLFGLDFGEDFTKPGYIPGEE